MNVDVLSVQIMNDRDVSIPLHGTEYIPKKDKTFFPEIQIQEAASEHVGVVICCYANIM